MAAALYLQAEYDDSLPRGVLNSLPEIKPDKPVVPNKVVDPTKPEGAVKPGQTPSAVTPKPDKPTTKPAPPPAAAPKPQAPQGKPKVEIINTSGKSDAGERAAALFREQGFEVATVQGGNETNNNTVVVARTTESSMINKLDGLPMRYVLQVSKDDNRANVVTVFVGKDF